MEYESRNEATLKLAFPKAYRSNYFSIINGIGYLSNYKRDVWIIPEFTLYDERGTTNKYEIRNLMIVMYLIK